MHGARLRWILAFVDRHERWPGSTNDEERNSIVDAGFAFADIDNEVHLTSLGELEIGYPETKD